MNAEEALHLLKEVDHSTVDVIKEIMNDDEVLEGLSSIISNVCPDVTAAILKEGLQTFDIDAFFQRIRTDELTEEEKSGLSEMFSGTLKHLETAHTLIDRIGQIAERVEHVELKNCF